MKIKRKIEVTTGDIRKGDRNEVYTCPVALAVNRVLRITNVNVGEDTISFRFNDGEFALSLPVAVIDWIEKFDMEKKVKPFTFVLRGDNE